MSTALFIIVLSFALLTIEIPFADGMTVTTEECGRSVVNTTAIAGGMKSSLNQWPWMAAIFITFMFQYPICGGTLINDRYVLTAADCVQRKQEKNEIETLPPNILHVLLGEVDVANNNDGATPIAFLVQKVIVHPKYIAVPINDLALLKLHGKVDFGIDIRPICLPTNDMVSDLFEGSTPIVASWGVTSEGDLELSTTLFHVQLKVIDNTICCVTYEPFPAHSTDVLCVRDEYGEGPSRQGDSGGPLMYLLNNQWYLIGVVSGEMRCGDPDFPGVFCRVSAYLDWIKENSK